MALLDNWLNADLFSTLRDKVNAIVSAVNAIGGGTVNQVPVKASSGDFDYTFSNPIFNTSSSTSNSIDYTSNKTFTVPAGLAYKPGNRARAYSSATPTSFIEGEVVSYSGTSLVIKPDAIGGSGTKTDWIISLGSAATPYVNSTTTFPSISFSGGGTVTINTNQIGYSKIGGLIHLSFKIDYSTSGGTYPCSGVTLTLPTELTGVIANFTGSAVVHDATFPFVIEEAGTTLLVHDGDTGNAIPGGSNKKIYGNITYPAA